MSEFEDVDAFRIPLRSVPFSVGEHSPRPCPICGQEWRPAAGSRLPCHARCLLTAEAQDIALLSSRPSAAIAQDLGVTVYTVEVAIDAARRRQGLK